MKGGRVTNYILFVKRLNSNRNKIAAVLGSLILMLMFQNCGNSDLSSSSSTGVSSSSTTETGTPTTETPTTGTETPTTGTGTPTTGTGTGVISGISIDVQRANCFSAIGPASILSLTSGGVAIASATVSSGLGSSSSGDTKTPPKIDIVVDRGITNTTVFNSTDNKCDTHLNLNLNCEVVAANPATPSDAPLSIANAFNSVGDNLLTAAVPMTPLNIAKGAFNANNCKAAILPASNTISVTIAPNTTNIRCVEGNFWVKLNISSSIAGIAGSKVSESKYIKVNYQNGCWAENRLKDSAGNLSKVINFGTAVAIDNNWAAVLAPTDDATSTILDVGSVYMYMYDGSKWVQKQKIFIPDSISYETISSIALRADTGTLIIGSPYRNARGMVYFYRRTGETWTLIQQVDPAFSGTNLYFGQAVAINEGYVVVGAPNYSGSLAKAGAISIYSYTSSGMSFVKSIYGDVADAAYGSVVALDNKILAVSAPQALGKESLSPGKVFIYDGASAGAFNLLTTKVGTVAAEKFGGSLAVYGKRVAIGSPNYAVGGVSGYGRVSYFEDYSLATAPKTFQGGAGANLGQSVALSTTGLYIGVPFANTKTGNVDHYLYADIAASKLYYRLLAYNGYTNSSFGNAIAVSGSNVVIGARIKNDPNDNSGAAYIYQFK